MEGVLSADQSPKEVRSGERSKPARSLEVTKGGRKAGEKWVGKE